MLNTKVTVVRRDMLDMATITFLIESLSISTNYQAIDTKTAVRFFLFRSILLI